MCECTEWMQSTTVQRQLSFLSWLETEHTVGGGQGDINTHKQSLVLHAEPLEPLDTVGQLRRVYIQAQRRYEQCVKANCSHQNNKRHLPEDRNDML